MRSSCLFPCTWCNDLCGCSLQHAPCLQVAAAYSGPLPLCGTAGGGFSALQSCQHMMPGQPCVPERSGG